MTLINVSSQARRHLATYQNERGHNSCIRPGSSLQTVTAIARSNSCHLEKELITINFCQLVIFGPFPCPVWLRELIYLLKIMSLSISHTHTRAPLRTHTNTYLNKHTQSHYLASFCSPKYFGY